MAAHSLIDGTDPAQAQVAPRMELARALIQSGADTSPAYPMQAIARAIQPLAGHMIQRDATSELARLYASQAGGMAEALRKYAPDHPLVTALQSSDPGVQALALRQAGPAMIELPKEAESKRRFGIESGIKGAELDIHRQQLEKPDFGPIDQDEYGRIKYGFREPFKKKVTTYNAPAGAEPGGAPSAPVIISSPADRMRLTPGTRYIAKDDPAQQVRVWGGAAP